MDNFFVRVVRLPSGELCLWLIIRGKLGMIFFVLSKRDLGVWFSEILKT